MFRFSGPSDESGAALLLALLVLVLLSLLGLFMSFSATTGVRISDNYESELQATYSALAGLSHARGLLRRLEFDDLLKGPDGTCDPSAAYRAEAKSYKFRMPLPATTAWTLRIADPSAEVAMIPDDGIISTGRHAGIAGMVLIPGTGICQTAPNPYGSGNIETARYFVKVTDNNGDASETAGDIDDNPFTDGDGIIIVRSMGVSRTVLEKIGSIPQRNSVAVFEARLKRLSTWRVGSGLIAIGSQVDAVFDGAFEISGGLFPGIATIDTNTNDAVLPDQIFRSAAASFGTITGGGISSPSVGDITEQIRMNRDQARLLQPKFLWNFVSVQAPHMADSTFSGSQNWLGSNAPYLGIHNSAEPLNAPGQDPRITVVNGDLHMSGSISGGGLLIVTGSFSCSGPFTYSGLILAIGEGSVTLTGTGTAIEGGLFAANLNNSGGTTGFGAPHISISGNNRISSNESAVRMAISLIPPAQIGFREIAGSDP